MGDEKAIAKPFNPSDYVEALKDRLKAAMLDVIPDEQWERLVRAEIQAFFVKRLVRDTYGSSEQPSHFSTLCTSILQEEFSKRIKLELAKPEWQGQWVNGELAVAPRVEEFMRKNAGEVLSRWVGTAFQNLVNGIYNHTWQPR